MVAAPWSLRSLQGTRTPFLTSRCSPGRGCVRRAPWCWVGAAGRLCPASLTWESERLRWAGLGREVGEVRCGNRVSGSGNFQLVLRASGRDPVVTQVSALSGRLGSSRTVQGTKGPLGAPGHSGLRSPSRSHCSGCRPAGVAPGRAQAGAEGNEASVTTLFSSRRFRHTCCLFYNSHIPPKVTLFLSSQTHRNGPLANLETSKTRKDTRRPLPPTHCPGPPDERGAEPRRTRPALASDRRGRAKPAPAPRPTRTRTRPDRPVPAVCLSPSSCVPTFSLKASRSRVALAPPSPPPPPLPGPGGFGSPRHAAPGPRGSPFSVPAPVVNAATAMQGARGVAGFRAERERLSLRAGLF